MTRTSHSHQEPPTSELDDLPGALTVEEAARLLRISRGLAFQQAAVYRETEGAEGIPNYRIGRVLRVPTGEFLRRFHLDGHEPDKSSEAPRRRP